MEFKKELIELRACDDAVQWVGEKSLQQAWAECERADWMLWYLQKTGLDIKKLTLLKVLCAETVQHLMKDQRSINALKVARDFAEGNATRKELADAADAADAVAYVAYVVYAAYAVADVYAVADDAVVYAAYAADAVAYVADAAAYAAVRKKHLVKLANIIRKNHQL